MIAEGVNVPVEFGKGATLKEAFIGRQVRRRGQRRVHVCCSCIAVEDGTLRRVARHPGLVEEDGLYMGRMYRKVVIDSRQ